MPGRLVFVAVWGLSLVLLAASLAAASLGLGGWQALLVMAPAVAAAGLVVWFDMHLGTASGTLKLFAAATLIFVMVMFALALPDWLTR